MIVQRFNLNLIPNQSPVIVHVNQYDTGTGRLIATLYEGNEPYSPNGTAVIQGTKPDGHGFQYTATLDGNVVTADLTEQMAPVAGDVRTQIVVTESSGVTGTFAFIIRVQPSALPSDTDMSESDYQYIEEAIREAQEAVETAQEATETAQEAVERAEAAITETQENAENSEAWAQGTRGGIPVEPTDPTYEHNAEYWAQYAERYAQGGLHYKASIPFANIPITGMREGDMYDITDDFTTDSRFTEGAGIKVKGGTNIAWNSDNKWDILALPYIPKTTFNGRSGSILPMAGDYDSKKILLSSALHIGGETQSDVQEALEALSNDGVKSFNGRSGSVLPIAGDYDSEKILLASVLHIGGETQENAQEALEALEDNKADRVDNAIEDNFAGLDANGNLKDSGKNAGDFATPSSVEQTLRDAEVIEGKNRLENKATSTGIFTVNSDKSITANGTYTGGANALKIADIYDTDFSGYIFNGCPSGGGYSNAYRLFYRVTKKSDGTIVNDKSAYDTGNGVALTHSIDTSTEYIQVWLQVDNNVTLSNKTFYPMISKEGGAYEPFYIPLKESKVDWTSQGVLGAKNLMPNNAKSQTINGVTFTVNDDRSITGVGTSNSSDMAYFVVGSGWGNSGKLLSETEIKAGETYILSKGFVKSGIALFIRFYQGSTDLGGISTKDEDNKKFTVPTNTDHIVAVIRIDSGVTISNSNVFYPMLRLASDPDDTYQPPAMTNRELTEKVFEKRTLTSADDLNNITETGIYGIRTKPINAPEDTTMYCTLIVQNTTAGDIRQIIIRSVNAAAYIYTRSYGGSPLAWTPWYKFTGTVVS